MSFLKIVGVRKRIRCFRATLGRPAPQSVGGVKSGQISILLASAGGLADVAFRTCQGLYHSFVDLNEVPKQVKHLANSLLLWSKVCQKVQQTVQQYRASSFASADGFSSDVLLEVLQHFRVACSEIEVMINQFRAARASSKMTVLNAAKWMFDVEKVQAAQNKLDDIRQTLIVALSAINRLESPSTEHSLRVLTLLFS